MINVDTKQTLGIILPNTNKALEEVIKKASPKELQTLTQGKDLKSLVNNILKQSLDTPSQNKTLLNLVKNNPTFKELGSTVTSAKELLAVLTQDKNSLPLESTLQKLLVSLKPANDTPKFPDNKILQEFTKIIQSVDVKALIEKIKVSPILITKDTSIDIKNIKQTILNDVKALIENLKTATKPSLQDTKTLQELVKVIQSVDMKDVKHLVLSDVKVLLEKLKILSKPRVPESKTLQEFSKEVQSLDLKNIKPSILADVKALSEKVKTFPHPTTVQDKKTITQSVKHILNTITQEKSTLPALEKTLKNFISDISTIKEVPLKSKIQDSGVFLEAKVKNLQTPKVELKQAMQDLSKLLETSKLPSVKIIHTQLKDLLSTDLFKNISNKELLGTSKESTQVLLQLSRSANDVVEKVQQKIAAPVEKSINPKDIIFSQDTKTTLTKISTMAHPEKLTTQTQLKEMFSNDLKAVLLKTHDEINNSTNPNKQEILKHIDKLTLQIDYHQLVSHLSDSSSLYLPYAWEGMEDGNINISKGKKDSFFCDINLTLKEYGELKLRLGIFEKNQLNINISAESDTLKEKIKANLPELKKQLFDAGIIPKSIRFLDETSNSYTQNSPDLDMGFEVKV